MLGASRPCVARLSRGHDWEVHSHRLVRRGGRGKRGGGEEEGGGGGGGGV